MTEKTARNMILNWSITATFLLLCSFFSEAKQTISLYTYYKKPPFIVDTAEQHGLFFDLARHLTANQPKYNFEVIYIPRRRLEGLLRTGELDGAIIGINPVWFDDKNETKYLWTSPIYHDTDDFISLKTKPFEYLSPASLIDTTFAGVSGLYYVKVSQLAFEGKVRRLDTIGDKQVIAMVELGRVDYGIVSRSALQYLIKNNLVEDIFHRSTIPHESYDRRILVPKALPEIHQVLEAQVSLLANDTDWQAILGKYQ